jgi:hypothetical protein
MTEPAPSVLGQSRLTKLEMARIAHSPTAL